MYNRPTIIQTPQFIRKLYEIVNLPSSDDIVSWDTSGEKFMIKNQRQFMDQIMKVHFN